MDLRTAAQEIRDTVSMDTVLGLYGYQARHGFMVCPFHGDSNASLKIYPGSGGWHCFGCGRGGSVIDFVMEHDGCDFRTATAALDGALGLHLLDEHEDPLQEQRREALARILDDLERLLLDEIADREKQIEIYMLHATRMTMEIAGKPKLERTAKEWTDLLRIENEMQYQEYKKERLNDLREEVRTWRREHRRAAKGAR